MIVIKCSSYSLWRTLDDYLIGRQPVLSLWIYWLNNTYSFITVHWC